MISYLLVQPSHSLLFCLSSFEFRVHHPWSLEFGILGSFRSFGTNSMFLQIFWIPDSVKTSITNFDFWACPLRGIPHEGPNPSFAPKSKFLQTHRDSKFLRNSQKLLRFQVLHFIDFNIRKRGHGISKFLFYEIEVSQNQNIHQDSI